MSTYNGEKYIESQLESIINQESVQVDVLVRDDGSTDSTCNILNQWQQQGLLTWYPGDNKGFAMSFMDLVQTVGEYDYYAFSDQDDIWFPTKLRTAISHLSKIDDSLQLYCSNSLLYKDGKVLGLYRKEEPYFNMYTSLVRNIATGCTMVFNYGIKELVKLHMPKHIIAHDFWMYQTAMLFGRVYYDSEATMYYRQHDSNQIGAKTTMYEVWSRRIRSFFYSNKDYGVSMQAQELLRCYSDLLSDDRRAIVTQLAEYKCSMSNKTRLLFNRKYSMGRPMSNILLRVKVLFGRL